ncbi:uncharacterized protein K452DRAFT_310630 [Aplosporella prunicola CBS 121167]|uniref:LPXTG-motif cell wall anchor domain protein n=1 Tax=Aplosporella prunicola CBS 121167 TaxID=1176127 RepID=A0A6A6B6I3_9PEZI|nr:uncharacterized protein K452DRAFT_310630 [Aplosporella prunicola CBS 121167]KAF2139742.1 hypothetical protein K452DRAFT_310630 [Aplosporella prunicola CBS 121167]
MTYRPSPPHRSFEQLPSHPAASVTTTPPRKPLATSPLHSPDANSASDQKLLHTPPRRAPTSPIAPGTPALSNGRARRLSSSSTATRPTPNSLSSTGSYFTPRSTGSGADAPSPATRKPPAHLETSNGPPFALITRPRPSHSDAARTPTFAHYDFAQYPTTPTESTPRPPYADDVRHSRTRSLPASHDKNTGRRSRSSSRDSAMASDDQSDYDFAYSHRGATKTNGAGPRLDLKNASNEDLFLNIAQDGPQRQDGDEDTARLERRRSRIARASRQSMPVNSLSSPIKTSTSIPVKSGAAEGRIGGSHYRRVSQLPSPSYTSAGRDQSLSAALAVEGQRSRFGMSVHSSFPLPKSRGGEDDAQSQNRRFSVTDSTRRTEGGRELRYRPSNLTSTSTPRSNNLPTTPLETSPEITSGRTAEQQSGRDGSESMDSTNAPSTVWDELDELKSRIKKLELTGKLPPTSGAAVSLGERPRTATTQATSVIASPKHHRKQSISPPETAVSATEKGASHPLLHSALAKCRVQVAPGLFRVLETTASDALDLSAMTGNSGSGSNSAANGAAVTERQLRRKADSMCRSLTELCIALCEGVPSPTNPTTPSLVSPALAPVPRRSSIHTNGDYQQQQPPRGASAEPDDGARNSPSRALNRIEARRISMHGGMSSAGNSPREPPDRERTTPTGRYSRNGSSLLSSRPRRATINNDDQEGEDDQTLRVPSRAMTDYSQQKRSNRLSREYTSQVPLPDHPPVAMLQHSGSLRRTNGVTPTSEQAPPLSASLLRDGSRRYLDRSTPPAYPSPTTSQENSMSSSEERRQRIAALTGGNSSYVSSPRSAAGISRTGSLSRRLHQNT